MAPPAPVRRKLWAYSRFFERTAEVVEPANPQELSEILLAAARDDRRLTFRAGGRAFDRQALNGDLVVSLVKLNGVAVDPVHPLVSVGPGATWGRIMDAALERGLVPAVTVTTSRATAGGTLSANALSRFSSAYGKEGGRVAEARIMTMDGTTHVCAPPDPAADPRTWTETERLFMGAVGGLGYLGAFVEITYRLLEPKRPIHVKTTVEPCQDLVTFADKLVGETGTVEHQQSDPCHEDRKDAIYGAVYTDSKGRRESLLFTSWYTTAPLKPMLPHQPRHPCAHSSSWACRPRSTASCGRLDTASSREARRGWTRLPTTPS